MPGRFKQLALSTPGIGEVAVLLAFYAIYPPSRSLTVLEFLTGFLGLATIFGIFRWAFGITFDSSGVGRHDPGTIEVSEYQERIGLEAWGELDLVEAVPAPRLNREVIHAERKRMAAGSVVPAVLNSTGPTFQMVPDVGAILPNAVDANPPSIPNRTAHPVQPTPSLLPVARGWSDVPRAAIELDDDVEVNRIIRNQPKVHIVPGAMPAASERAHTVASHHAVRTHEPIKWRGPATP